MTRKSYLILTDELRAEGTMRDIVRVVQNARKNAGFEVDDRIILTLESDDSHLSDSVKAHAETIKTETLAIELKTSGASSGVPVKVNGAEMYVAVEKAAK
jgi:isoleucyl-tRNA synthetase